MKKLVVKKEEADRRKDNTKGRMTGAERKLKGRKEGDHCKKRRIHNRSEEDGEM